MATLPSSFSNPALTNLQQKGQLDDLLDFLGDLLGPDSADKAAARSALGAWSQPRVQGLLGNVNSTTPLTKFDLSAQAVTLRDTNGATVTRYNTGPLTCDLALAGSAANGRDQAGAFAPSNFVYLYLIWNGTTLATLASLTAPASFTGSSLPSGYTHWAFAAVLRWNSSSNIVPGRQQGAKFMYSPIQGILGGGGATTETPIVISSIVPPIALRTQISNRFGVTTNASGGAQTYLSIRHISGLDTWLTPTAVQVANGTALGGSATEIPYVGTSIFYLFNNEAGSSNIASRGATIEIQGFVIPNGDA